MGAVSALLCRIFHADRWKEFWSLTFWLSLMAFALWPSWRWAVLQSGSSVNASFWHKTPSVTYSFFDLLILIIFAFLEYIPVPYFYQNAKGVWNAWRCVCVCGHQGIWQVESLSMCLLADCVYKVWLILKISPKRKTSWIEISGNRQIWQI